MERFVFIAAVTVAIIFGFVIMVDGPSWHVEWDDDADARGLSPVVGVAPGRLEPQVFAGDQIRIRYAAAIISVIPEDRQDFSVEIDNPGHTPMPSISVVEGRVVVDGQLRGRIHDCRDNGADLRGYTFVTYEQMPRITVRAPRRLSIDVGGAGRTEIGATETLDLDFSGCGSASLGDVAGELNVDLAGSGEVRAAAASGLNAAVAGNGTLEAGPLTNRADIDIAGSGSVALNNLNGALDVSGAGSGSTEVRGGAVTTADIELAGSGDVTIRAPVQRLDVSIVGSGSVEVEGEVGEINAEIAGSGNVNARSVTGAINRQVWGSGEVNVGQ